MQKYIDIMEIIFIIDGVSAIARWKVSARKGDEGMETGLIGLGRMGLHIAMNMQSSGLRVYGYDIQQEAKGQAEEKGIPVAQSLRELVAALQPPRIIWLMLPAGDITKSMVHQLYELLKEGDYVIDGGNSFYRDSIRNYEFLKKKNIHFYDAGTSGGIRGALEGANFMIGGEREHFSVIEELFKSIAADHGYLYAGEAGSGHYLKMVHNGIEYGMMQAIGEGFELLQHSPYTYDNAQVAGLWNHGSVIRSWLMELAEEAFKEDEQLDAVKGIMYASGEGQWTVEEAMRCNVSVPVISTALMMRYRSLYEDTFTGKVVASLRKGFGGHKTAK